MATHSTGCQLGDRAVIRRIEVRGGIVDDHAPRRIGPNLVVRWEHWTGAGTSADTNGTAPAGTPDCELALEFHSSIRGAANCSDQQWDTTNNGKLAVLSTRDPRVIRAYGELLLELAQLVEDER